MNKSIELDKVETLGEKIDNSVKKYFDLYLAMQTDDFWVELTKGDFKSWALIDLRNQLFVIERAIEKLTQKIDKYEKEQKNESL